MLPRPACFAVTATSVFAAYAYVTAYTHISACGPSAAHAAMFLEALTGVVADCQGIRARGGGLLECTDRP